jgi:hypothetical protein
MGAAAPNPKCDLEVGPVKKVEMTDIGKKKAENNVL